ncbi:hypothetical protein PAAG_00409 [Paracoccidioides lutzii Pb01]|uniref:Uncharacterized protein n=1 Tax=Paracoccidioides lutzii (strain ATCC MYA-826 / Pb01) TaxID=502779 RepID=C1GPG4_PARBA|nr:hypothetical protein PAAG_00409 [Paracoccidioides lutzii Pb01]EEH36086.1 hypothetical protein PAAG_00409 [Paracoccidioides lutzii Pb01]
MAKLSDRRTSPAAAHFVLGSLRLRLAGWLICGLIYQNLAKRFFLFEQKWVLPTVDDASDPEQPNPYHQNLAKAKLRAYLPRTRTALPPATEGKSPNDYSVQHQAFARFLISHAMQSGS